MKVKLLILALALCLASCKVTRPPDIQIPANLRLKIDFPEPAEVSIGIEIVK